MAGTDEDAVAAADDALYVLTAVLLTPAKFPSVLGDDYPEACAALGLAPLADGYGLVIGQDGSGARWTVVIDDVSLVAVAIASWDCGMEYDLSPDERTVVAALPGWPLAVAVAAPGVPAPHDPDPEAADGPLLAPPDTSTWGSAQRRLGADEIALQWAMWREQIDDSAFPSPNGGSAGGDGTVSGAAVDGASADGAVPQTSEGAVLQTSGGATSKASEGATADGVTADGDASRDRTTGDEATQDSATGGSAAAGATSGAAGNGTPRKGHSGVRRVLAEARAYVDSPPPLGRVRSSFASGDARTLRADGPGWSLVARTDDIAFVLLDDEPGEVLPVGRGPELPGLLEALDKMAVRPS
ncbi:hypothetical protein [Streptomyces sp. SAI-041]|uniref:hypothetical protein n=1 Tax=Streptomyces sp. SAI-041 TaxID=2940548 RepID=UPI002474C5DF|nr:hypothetical protein [Streptomyces sp. SAI-041]MDH6552992.1 hypothetical protein [Streptomyces sp. SAI-041]